MLDNPGLPELTARIRLTTNVKVFREQNMGQAFHSHFQNDQLCVEFSPYYKCIRAKIKWRGTSPGRATFLQNALQHHILAKYKVQVSR